LKQTDLERIEIVDLLWLKLVELELKSSKGTFDAAYKILMDKFDELYKEVNYDCSV
jgi:hypothetical protein